jgi:hypothetical protein
VNIKQHFQNNFAQFRHALLTPKPPKGGLNTRRRLFKPPLGGLGVSGVSLGIYFENFPKQLKKILLLLIATILLISVKAAVPFEKDTSHPEFRQFSKSEIDSYKKQRAFKYRDAGPEESGLMSLISYYINRFLDRIFYSRVGGTSIYQLILYGLMVFGVIMLIFQFLKISPRGLVSRSSPAISVASADGDNIHEIDFDKLIQQSAAQQNYRLAVRFWYLKMLKILSDAQLINWQISKTNYDYYYELKQQALRNEFLSLTRTFENSWYGNHNLSTERYQEAMGSFLLFFTTLNQKG